MSTPEVVMSRDNLTRIEEGIKKLSRSQRKYEIIVDLIWAAKEVAKLRKQVTELRNQVIELNKQVTERKNNEVRKH